MAVTEFQWDGKQPYDDFPGPQVSSRRTYDREVLIGLAMVLMCTVGGAALPVLTRYSAERIDPLVFCAGSNLVAALATVPLLAVQGSLRPLFMRRYRAQLIVFSLLASVGTSLALIYGLRRVDAITGVLLLQIEPIYSLILSAIVLEEFPTRAQVLATIAILAGIGSVFASSEALRLSLAALLVLMTPLMWQSSHLISLRLMPPLTPTCMAAARYFYASIVLTAIAAAQNASGLETLARPEVAFPVIATGVLAYAISALTWYGAINRLSLSFTTAVCVPGVPLLSVLFAIIFLHERATARELAGLGVAVGGIIGLVLGADPSRRKVTGELETPMPPGL